MLYTIVPSEEIWATEEVEPSFAEMSVNGCLLQVEVLGNGRGRVVRILSTDPQDYLNIAYQPGSLVQLE